MMSRLMNKCDDIKFSKKAKGNQQWRPLLFSYSVLLCVCVCVWYKHSSIQIDKWSILCVYHHEWRLNQSIQQHFKLLLHQVLYCMWQESSPLICGCASFSCCHPHTPLTTLTISNMFEPNQKVHGVPRLEQRCQDWILRNFNTTKQPGEMSVCYWGMLHRKLEEAMLALIL